jgi:hypothetical protein
LKADVIIDWKNVPRYIDTIIPTVNGKVQCNAHAPTAIKIFIDDYCQVVRIDLLPLVRMGLKDNRFRCIFARDLSGYDHHPYNRPSNHEHQLQVRQRGICKSTRGKG